MRIISGKYKGRHIRPPANFRARPTTDFARESLFNIIGNTFDFEDLHIMDLFAGTGSIGLEFASRGAGKVEMVEKNYIHSEFIRRTLKSLDTGNARVIKSDVFRYLNKASGVYDIIFADPPYDLPEFEKVPLRILDHKNLLKQDGWFILEHSKQYTFESLPGFFDHRNYGSVNFSFFQSE
ncbi:MAG TPA: 16S rRNA (guanine(966)-N(2))-methyltransferase RsmD [Bacteroidales bacterium]|nr:16S rRNA (guanine(966)-N(2))-methyltransferase RsmD [Bacteroidales bacterium]